MKFSTMIMLSKSILSFLLLATAVNASPALVWRKSAQSSGVVHSANEIPSDRLLAELLRDDKDESLNAVVFLIGRGDGGSENLSQLAQQGLLPNIADKQSSAHSVHHHVTGIQNGHSVVKDTSKLGYNTLLVNLSEFHHKLSSSDEAPETEITFNGSVMSKAEKATTKRAKLLTNANLLVVNVDSNTSPGEIDAAVVKAIEHASVKNVVLSAVRSIDEVKHERLVQSRRRLEIMHETGNRMLDARHRRLEQAQDDGNGNGNQANNADLSGIYYVSLTPNILAGLLFFFLFTTITYIGVGCMGMISGQDVFVSKMPVVEREA